MVSFHLTACLLLSFCICSTAQGSLARQAVIAADGKVVIEASGEQTSQDLGDREVIVKSESDDTGNVDTLNALESQPDKKTAMKIKTASSLSQGEHATVPSCNFAWMESPSALADLVKRTSPETDKVTAPQYAKPGSKVQGHSYQTQYYGTLMQLVRRKCAGQTREERTVRMLEIGLGCGMPQGPGGSLHMWRTLFQAPLVLDLHMMEFAEDCGRKFQTSHPEMFSNPTVGLHFGNQYSGADLDRVVAESGGKPFDLVVDDGSHVNEHQRFSLLHLFPHLAAGGVYVIEDTHSACMDWKVNYGGDKEGGDAGTGGTSDCLKTQAGEPTIMATVLEWSKNLAGMGTFPQELNGCTDIHVFRESVAFSKEI